MFGYGLFGLGRFDILLIPAFVLALYAQTKVKSTFAKYSKVGTASGFTGAQVARRLLNDNGLGNVAIEQVGGALTDHYDPRTRILRLSPDVYHGDSLAAFGVAAHETGHAIQHVTGYVPLGIRNNIFPIAAFGSQAAMPLFFIGLLMGFGSLVDIGILVFSIAVAFQLLTLPVEFNASGRAIRLLKDGGYLVGNEVRGAKSVLDAAALTYLAAALSSILQLLRLILIRNDRRD